MISLCTPWKRGLWLLALAVMASHGAIILAQEVTRRASLDGAGFEVNDDSSSPSIANDGRMVAFLSYATDLVAGDTNYSPDVFVRDLVTGVTTRISVSSSGVEANSFSADPAISGDGSTVAFTSLATNLVQGDSNNMRDVFVRDLDAQTTERVSLDGNGGEANGNSYFPMLSQDGRYVVFTSYATNLVAGDTNDAADIFVKDRVSGATTLVSKSSTGEQGNGPSRIAAISADGRYVAIESDASNLIVGDANGVTDIFLHDTKFAVTVIVSTGAGGVLADGESRSPSISADARYVVFASQANNLVALDTNGLVDVFARDTWTSSNQLVSVSTNEEQADGASDLGVISADARYVAFRSRAGNLAPGDANGFLRDVFLRDRMLGTTVMASVTDSGSGGNDDSFEMAVSGDGRLTVFTTEASNLVAGDRNHADDVCLHGRELTLEAAPPAVGVGDVLTFASYFGAAQNPATVWAVQVDQVPMFMMVFAGQFAGDERLVLSGPVPSGLGTVEVTFRVYSVGPTAFLVKSNDVIVAFH